MLEEGSNHNDDPLRICLCAEFEEVVLFELCELLCVSRSSLRVLHMLAKLLHGPRAQHQS